MENLIATPDGGLAPAAPSSKSGGGTTQGGAGDNPFEGSGYRSFQEYLVTIGVLVTTGSQRSTPPFVAPEEVSYVQDDHLVLGLVVDGVARAYPHNIG